MYTSRKNAYIAGANREAEKRRFKITSNCKNGTGCVPITGRKILNQMIFLHSSMQSWQWTTSYRVATKATAARFDLCYMYQYRI